MKEGIKHEKKKSNQKDNAVFVANSIPYFSCGGAGKSN